MDIAELRFEHAHWDAFVRASGVGSPFHLTAWKRAIEETFGLRAHYLMARRGPRLEGVLPLFETRTLTGRRALISVPYGVYGGVCATSREAREALVTAATVLGRRRGVAYVELRERRDLELGLPIKRLYVGFARAISKDEEHNALAIPRKQRRMTRLGARYGLRTSVDRRHLDRVYDIYAESVRNLGTPVFPRRLFHALADAFEQDCEVLAVHHDETIVAGVLSFRYDDQILPYYGGALRPRFVQGINDFMYWQLMCRAANSGCRIFDFGRSREGTGSYDFKRHWGFEPVPLPYQYVLLDGAALPDVSPANPRFLRASELWKRLPLGITNRVGPLVTRYLP
jgi:FemAB-related protein (PEP-CTERM system-associated)